MSTEAAKATEHLKKKNDPKQTNWSYGAFTQSMLAGMLVVPVTA